MHANDPSGTAMIVALHRAAHQVIDEARIFADPLAVSILGLEGTDWARQMDGDPGLRRFRFYMCARAQFAETRLLEAVERSEVTQLVLLGAGLDTFAYRNPFEGRLKVIEVDHPATQLWKRDRLDQAGIAVPESVRYASFDLEEPDLIAHLEGAGFDRSERFFVICLGVFLYLTKSAIQSLLESIAALGGQVVFDYSDPPETLSAYERDALAVIQRRLTAAGEPYISYFEPTDLHPVLRSIGFSVVEDLDTEAWMTRYGGTELLADWRKITANPNRGAHILFAAT